MKLIQFKANKQTVLVPDCYPFKIKNGVLEHFTRSIGGGWKKTKSYKIVEDVELPDKWDKSITWLDVAKFYDQYGIEVANVYADRLTAGIVARQTATGYGKIYGAIKHLIPDNFDVRFFELLRCEYMLSCFGMFLFDIVGMDDSLGKDGP